MDVVLVLLGVVLTAVGTKRQLTEGRRHGATTTMVTGLIFIVAGVLRYALG